MKRANTTGGWADISEDLLEEIIKKIGPTVDFAHFASVCRSWHSVAMRIKNPPWRNLPLLLLTKEDNPGSNNSARTFYSPSDRTFHELRLDCLGRRCIGSTDGWLAMFGGDLEEIHMLNPVTGVRIPLPSPSTIEGWLPGLATLHYGFVHKVFLSCSPLSDNCVALATCGIRCGLALARPGDKAWTTVAGTWRQWPFQNAVYHRGEFYAISGRGEIFWVDQASKNAVLIASGPQKDRYYCWGHIHYLVESLGDLFHVFQTCLNPEDKEPLYQTIKFDAFKLSFDHGHEIIRWERIKNLGDRSFFIDFSTSKSISGASTIAGCKENCIYFTDVLFFPFGRRVAHDMGSYSLEDEKLYQYQPYSRDDSSSNSRSSSPFTLVLPDSYSPVSRPVWFFPSLR